MYDLYFVSTSFDPPSDALAFTGDWNLGHGVLGYTPRGEGERVVGLGGKISPGDGNPVKEGSGIANRDNAVVSMITRAHAIVPQKRK